MTKRESLRNLIFGSTSLPTGTPTVYSESSPPVALTGAASVSRLEFTSNGLLNKSYLYVATGATELVIIHQGHTTTLAEIGVQELAQSLLNGGKSVLIAGMPGMCGNGGSGDHNTYSSLRPFVEHVIAAINSLAGSYAIHMTGISGGGWTTVVCAAIDERIIKSAPVAGSLPWGRRDTGSLGDWEQSTVSATLDYAGQYALGCKESGRQVLLLHNRNDSCCFARSGANGSYGMNYQAEVVDVVQSVVDGVITFVEDTSHSEHKISTWARNNVLLPFFGITPPVDVTIDDGDAGWACNALGTPNTGNQYGVWTRWTDSGAGANLANAGDYHTANTGAACSCTWTFTGLAPGNYAVSATWLGYSNRATNAQYKIYDGATLVATVTKDQTGSIQLYTTSLGTFTIASGTLVVELSNAGANGQVVADKIRVQGA